MIAFTDYSEPALEILIKAHELIEKLDIEKNEKDAILYIMDVLSANMLDKDERKKYIEVTTMLINPREEYLYQKGKEEGRRAKKEELRKEIEEELLEKINNKGN